MLAVEAPHNTDDHSTTVASLRRLMEDVYYISPFVILICAIEALPRSKDKSVNIEALRRSYIEGSLKVLHLKFNCNTLLQRDTVQKISQGKA